MATVVFQRAASAGAGAAGVGVGMMALVVVPRTLVRRGGITGAAQQLRGHAGAAAVGTLRFSTAAGAGTAKPAPKKKLLSTVEDGVVKEEPFPISKDIIEQFHRDGYALIPNVLSEAEVCKIEEIYDKFIRGEMNVPGKDFCDMSQAFGIRPEQFNLVNAMLPRVYYPPLKGNIFERRCASITHQLFNDPGFVIDYDQFLAKKPNKKAAVFAWHQDLAYWPVTPDTRTVTFSLAIDSTTVQNGCLQFVAGTHKEKELRNHAPFAEELAKSGKADGITRDDAHALQVILKPTDKPQHVCVPRGSVSIHNENVLHGSAGNFSDGWRRTYVLAFRHRKTVAWEREHGFTHSHNDSFNWDQFHSWVKK